MSAAAANDRSPGSRRNATRRSHDDASPAAASDVSLAGRCAEITIDDAVSGCYIVNVRMSMVEFANAISSLACRPAVLERIGSTAEGHRFDRVKCRTCDDMGNVGEIGEVLRVCPACNGAPLRRWICDAWPGLEIVLPQTQRDFDPAQYDAALAAAERRAEREYHAR